MCSRATGCLARTRSDGNKDRDDLWSDCHGRTGRLEYMKNQQGGRRSFENARAMIFLGIVVVPLVPYLTVLILSAMLFVNSSIRSSQAALRQVVDNQVEVIQRYLDERLNDLRLVLHAYSPGQLADPEILADIFRVLHQQSGAFVDLGLVDASGNHLAYCGPYVLQDKNYAGAEWFQTTRRHGFHVSDVFLGYRDVPHLIVALSTGGEHPLILRATLDSDAFSRIVESVRIGATGEAFLLNDRGQYQTRHPGKWDLLETAHDVPAYSDTGQQTATLQFQANNGRHVLMASATLNNGRWRLIAQQELADAASGIIGAGVFALIVSALGGAVTLSLAFFASGYIDKALAQTEEEKDLLRSRLDRSVRLAELGEMAAGFAHEINNPLQVIRAELTLIKIHLSRFAQQGGGLATETVAELNESLAQSLLQIERCGTITASILRIGRQESSRPVPINPGEVVQAIALLMERKTIARGIIFTRRIANNLPPFLGDQGKLQQIFLNLLNNAFHAVGERWGKDGGRVDFIASVNEAGQVLFQVKDNGPGMPQTVLDNMYTPFFTTKPPEKGTGLGLAVCYRLIASMGGVIEVDTREQVGTVFSVRFPAVAAREGSFEQSRSEG